MVNDTNNSKLDQAIKQTLSNYEAPYNAADWTKMESMLDAAPTSGNFKWSYSLNILIGIVVLGGIYFIYNSISSSDKIENTNDTEVQQPVENPVNTNTVISKPVPTPPAVSAPTENIPVSKNDITPTVVPVAKEEASVEKEPVITENKNKKAQDVAGKDEKIAKKTQRVFVKGNEPIFGDMLDSSKGIVHKTKENEATKKAVKAQPDNSIGWNSFLLKTNLDSLKKYQEQQQKDSVK